MSICKYTINNQFYKKNILPKIRGGILTNATFRAYYKYLHHHYIQRYAIHLLPTATLIQIAMILSISSLRLCLDLLRFLTSCFGLHSVAFFSHFSCCLRARWFAHCRCSLAMRCSTSSTHVISLSLMFGIVSFRPISSIVLSISRYFLSLPPWLLL